MLANLQALLPIFAYFVLGTILRSLRIASPEHAQFIFRLVFFVTLPALAFGAIADSALTINSIVLPITGFLVNVVCGLIAYAYARLSNLDAPQAGSVVLGASIVNMVFMFPFILATLGREALADAVLYDVGNGLFVATGAYLISSRFGAAGGSSMLASLGRVIRAPLFLAVIAAAVMSVNSLKVPALIDSILGPLGAMTMPMILIALGMSFSAARLRDSIVYSTVLIRMAGGLLVGLIFVIAFGLQGSTAVVVIAAAAAPIGFNSVTLASVGKLDAEHTTASLSVSIAIGLVTASTIVLAGARWLSAH